MKKLSANTDEDVDAETQEIRMRSLSLWKRMKETQASLSGGLLSGPGHRFKMFSPRVGTPIYRAPEILHRGQMYSESIDLWAAGCCICFMLVGLPPFYSKDREKLYQNIKYAEPKLDYNFLTEDARDLCM